MVTLTLRTLAKRRPRSDLVTVANQVSAAPPASKTMTSQTLTPARARLHASYRNLTLWTLQGWLAMFFIAAGYAKLTEPMTNLINLMGWPAVAPENMVRGLGVVEIVLAIGVLSPLISWRIGRPLLMTAATGLIVLESTMLVIHALSQDVGLAVVNAILLAFTVPVLLGRRKAV